jgi:hypothetical protein
MTSIVNFQDLLGLYTNNKRRNSVRSNTSFSTDWSHNTEVQSNTTYSLQAKQQKKRRFFIFTKVLTNFLKKKDPAVCKDAQAIIQECEQKQMRGDKGHESLFESLRAPLKEAVGTSYWREAKVCLNEAIAQQEKREFEPIPLNPEGPEELSDNDLLLLSNIFKHEGHSNWINRLREEKERRRTRFWMVIRILMKYLENWDPNAFVKARDVLQNFAKLKKTSGIIHLDFHKSIKRGLIKVAGKKAWSKSESHLTKILVQKADDEAIEIAFAEEASSFPHLSSNLNWYSQEGSYHQTQLNE